MSTVILRKLSQVWLNTTFARTMEDGSITHYSVPYDYSSNNPLKDVKDYIMKTESKEGSEIEFVLEATASLVSPDTFGNVNTQDVSSILKHDPKVKKSLKKHKAQRLIHETDLMSKKDRVINFLARVANPKIVAINKVLIKIQKLSSEELMLGKGRLLPTISHRFGLRKYNFVKYICIAFEAPDYLEAQDALLSDLRILQDNDLIMGHLSMPSLIALADTIGSGHQMCALFCFPIIDDAKLEKLIGKELLNANKLCLKHLGVLYENLEGGINYLNDIDYHQKYKIKTITVTDLSYDKIQEEVKVAFNESIPTVNKAAAMTRKLLKEYPEQFAKAEQELNKAVQEQKELERELTEDFMTLERRELLRKVTKRYAKTLKKSAKRSKKKTPKKRK